MDKIIGFVITAGHLDIEWYQPMRSYRFWTLETMEDLKLAAERPDFGLYVLDGQVFPLEEYLSVVPEDENAMKELIKNRKLAIGPFYTQFDEWIPSAENIIRNCLFGNRRAKKFGEVMKAGYLPDNFGHPLQLPQILQNFGIDSLMSVSYTHLDVYKRQMCDAAACQIVWKKNGGNHSRFGLAAGEMGWICNKIFKVWGENGRKIC